jgi:uncharacterized protein
MNKVNLILILILGVLAVLLLLNPGGCSTKPSSGLATMKVPIGNTTFTLEVADTEYSRERGLMHRDSMPADHGMIFVFPDDRRLNFWMKNTLIPLDILYLDSAGVVLNIDQMAPKDTTTQHPSDGPARYAIELNQGTAAKVGVKPGDKVTIGEIPRRK